MNHHITVALIGATSKTGKHLIDQLLTEGYTVKTLIRKPQNYTFTHPLLQIVEGDIKDLDTAHRLIEGCDVVLSSLGQLPGETLISSLAATNIISAMNTHNIKRYLFVCGLNIDVPGDQKSDLNKEKSDWMKRTFPEVVADKQLAYNIVAASNIDWTMVRLPFIKQTDERGTLAVSLEDCPGEQIYTSDLADFLVSQITNELYFKTSPFVASL